jgi:outer membrane lipopolysaccharide assembly protein LptE/RlpB
MFLYKTKQLYRVLLIVFVFSCTLSACGFHLRQSSLNNFGIELYTYVSDVQPQYQGQLSQAFRRMGLINQIPSKQAPDTNEKKLSYQLICYTILESEIVASYTPQAQPSEMRLTMTMPYEVKNSEGKIIASKKNASVERIYQVSPSQIGANSQEAKIIRQEMIQALSQTIVVQLNQLLPQINNQPTNGLQ